MNLKKVYNSIKSDNDEKIFNFIDFIKHNIKLKKVFKELNIGDVSIENYSINEPFSI